MKLPVPIFGLTAMFMVAIVSQKHAAPAPHEVTVQGCVLKSGDSLLLKEEPPGRSYVLQGDLQPLEQRVGKELKVDGEEQSPSQGQSSLEVKRWKQVGDCKAAVDSLAAPSAAGAQEGPTVPIAGKTGQASTEVPDTNTSSAGRPTPPVDLNRSRLKPPGGQPAGAPPTPEQAGQNPQAADRMAVAASRAEIAAGGGTLGVEGDGSGGSGSNRSTTGSAAGPTTEHRATVRMEQNSYSPGTVTIHAGQTVTWTNQTQSPHTVVLSTEAATNPKDVKIPAAARPFDSGKIPPGGSFSHSFPVPGTYKYFCSLHEGDGMVGEIIVRPH